MLPVNRLRANRLKRLRVFAGAEHGHVAQQPKELKTD
jgi:ribosomal protein L13